MNSTGAQSRLSYLLGIDQCEVDADLEKYQGRLAKLISEIHEFQRRPREQRGPAEDAKIAHFRMIQAHEFCEDDMLPPEVQTFYAAIAVERIARDAELAAFEKGTIASLSRQMEEIRFREGLEIREDNGIREQGAHNYHQLAERQAELLKKIEETVIVYFLRKYRLDEQAKLYERDRSTFEIQREVGRILMMEGGSTPEKATLLSGYIGRTYGHDAVERVLSRLREIRSRA